MDVAALEYHAKHWWEYLTQIAGRRPHTDLWFVALYVTVGVVSSWCLCRWLLKRWGR